MLETIKSMAPARRWEGPCGYKHLLRLALPLVAANISVSAMLFTDRLVLSRYSMETIAASLPAGVMSVTVSAFFQGLISYVSVFTAQYTGAGRPERAAAALWQGLYLALIAGAIIGLTYFAAPWLFSLGGHPANVQALEVTYYRILAVPTVFAMAFFALSSFLAGLGRTRLVMWGNLLGAFVNIPLTVGLVFGWRVGGAQLLPEMGIAGAATATVTSWLVSVAFFCYFVFNRRMEKSHKVFQSWAFDPGLFRRMVAFGSPGGLQRVLDMGGFTFFSFSVGRLGEFYLAANNIVFSIEAIAFFPLLGLGVAISILTGQAVGREEPGEAGEALVSGVGLSIAYFVLVCLPFLLYPWPMLSLFMSSAYEPGMAHRLMEQGAILLRFVAAYTLFDGLYLCSFGVLSGAGDVFAPTVILGCACAFLIMLPIGLLFWLGAATIYSLWVVFVVNVWAISLAMAARYKQGRWRAKRVIERAA